MNKLIAFTGSKNSGKTTAADFLHSKYGHQPESFATQMKEGVKLMFGLTDNQVYGDDEEKSKPIPKLSYKRDITPRHLLQTIGTEWGRDMIDPDIWLYEIMNKFKAMKGIPGYRGMVISDLRFNNEAEWVTSQGGIVIKIDDPFEALRPTHTSESAIGSGHINCSITNHKNSKAEFYADIEEAIQKIAVLPPVPVPEVPIKDLIVEWADKVFPDRTINNAIQKMVLEEIPEYLTSQNDPMELADLGILIYDIAHLAGVNLESAIRAKMEINMKRNWAIDRTTGLMNHIGEE